MAEATEVDAEALNSENVYWIDSRKDKQFIGTSLRNGRFKVYSFVHASEVSSVGLIWEGRDMWPIMFSREGLTPRASSAGTHGFARHHHGTYRILVSNAMLAGRDKKKNNMMVAIKTPKAPASQSDWPSNWWVNQRMDRVTQSVKSVPQCVQNR